MSTGKITMKNVVETKVRIIGDRRSVFYVQVKVKFLFFKYWRTIHKTTDFWIAEDIYQTIKNEKITVS